MNIEQAATFLAGSILLMMGFVVIVIGAVAINYILQKYWKPVKIFTPDSWPGFNPPAAISPDKKQEPVVLSQNESKTL